MKLSGMICEGDIVLDFRAKTKDEALAVLAQVAAGVLGYDRALSALREREEVVSTGIGNGVALPHIRLDFVDTPVVVFARAQKPVEFGAMDDGPCRLFFLVIGPTGQGVQQKYLQAMGEILQMVRSSLIREGLLAVETAGEAIEMIRGYEDGRSSSPFNRPFSTQVKVFGREIEGHVRGKISSPLAH